MAHDCAPDQIRVVAVAPGSVDTPMSQRAVESSGKSSLEELGFSRSPKVLGHVGKPEEVAEVIAWLASDKASFVNGVTVPVDGGLLAKLI
jgi:NAD(P)-dependent dehydrogenase (short-subunit alcohol dehydrogenase family)